MAAVPDHGVSPYRATDGRARCRTCDGAVVGTPAGWFHTPDDAERDDGYGGIDLDPDPGGDW